MYFIYIYTHIYVIYIYIYAYITILASQLALVVKNPPADAGDIRVADLIRGLERCPRGGNGNALQYSCLEKPMDGGAWGLQSQTQLR